MNRHSSWVSGFHAALLAASAILLSGCTPDEPKKEAPKASAAPEKKADLGPKEIYEQRCTGCHGVSGKGDGATAAALDPKPRNYTDKAWQASVTDEQLRTIILKGGAAVGKSAMMPDNPDLEGKPEVVQGLVAIVRGFGK